MSDATRTKLAAVTEAAMGCGFKVEVEPLTPDRIGLRFRKGADTGTAILTGGSLRFWRTGSRPALESLKAAVA